MRSRLARLGTPQWVLAVLSVLLLVTGIGELLVAGWSWIYITHVGSGALMLAVTPWRRLIKPTVVLVGAVYVFLYVWETIPGGADGGLEPTSDATLILNGFVLAALMVALMWPWTSHVRRGGESSRRRRGASE